MRRHLTKLSVGVVGIALAGCSHGVARRRAPASADAHAWKKAGICTAFNVRYPLHRPVVEGERSFYRAADPASRIQFLTSEPDGCRQIRLRASEKIEGSAVDHGVAHDCEIFGGEVASLTKAPGLMELFEMSDSTGQFKFRTLTVKACETQGFRRDGNSLGFANP